MKSPIVIVPYDPAWPDIFDDEMERITGVVGHIIRRIAHVGSTAVPGLAANAIVDIAAGVADAESAKLCLKPLARIGYADVAPPPDGDAARYYYLGRHPKAGPVFHLHLMEFPSRCWDKRLLFRNYLRTHPDAAREYERLKRELAARFRDDGPRYREAKAGFIEKALRRARREKKNKEGRPR
jgi:GrpB-like predicted nucleotidyltransferase (UPF0157 family)